MTRQAATIYIVRHGQTQWNVEKKVQGHEDIELNQVGKDQAIELGQLLKHIQFDAVFSSDLLRAKQTAEIAILQKEIAIQTTKVLRERYFGRLQGQDWSSKDKDLQHLWSKIAHLTEEERKNHNLEGVENDEDMIARFIPFLREVAVAYPGKTLLAVTHAGVMRLLLYHVGYIPYADDPDFVRDMPVKYDIENTAYIKLVTDGVEFNIVKTFGITIKK